MAPPGENGRGGWRARALLAVTLALLATGALLYGAVRHDRPVMMQLKQAMPGFADSGPGGPGGFAPVYQAITISESEPDLVREVTYAGVTRLPTGEIVRTYTGAPPSLCPT
jgi:hypothetical protein